MVFFRFSTACGFWKFTYRIQYRRDWQNAPHANVNMLNICIRLQTDTGFQLKWKPESNLTTSTSITIMSASDLIWTHFKNWEILKFCFHTWSVVNLQNLENLEFVVQLKSNAEIQNFWHSLPHSESWCPSQNTSLIPNYWGFSIRMPSA